jgi:hypothetical protein
MAHNLHDRLRIDPGICQVRDGAVPKIMEDKILDSLLLAEPLNLSIGVIELNFINPFQSSKGSSCRFNNMGRGMDMKHCTNR